MTMDLSASILALTGTTVPADTRLDGINLMPILEGRAPVVDRTVFWRTNAGGHSQRAVRSGDFKLLLDGNSVLVYNVRTDLGERDDLASRRPDVARRLRPLLAAWEQDVNAEAKARGTTPITEDRAVSQPN